MDKAELGNKHICSACGTKFYDLNKEIPTCPKCGTEIIIVVKPRLGRPPLNKNIVKAQTPEKEKDTQETINEDETKLDDDMAELISIEDLDENIISENSNIEENEDNENNITDIANIELTEKEEDTDL
ncbi:MAG: TIGR02300 family protein [Alphaproteobacteria bacterium]|nr:TIGR02300 family protein [Alphaproteobacteria bacterium]